MAFDTSDKFESLSLGRRQQIRKNELLELLLYWFAYSFALACLGVLVGLLYGTGHSLMALASAKPTDMISLILMLFFVVGGAVYLVKKTTALVYRGGADNG